MSDAAASAQILRAALTSLLLRTAATHPDPNLRGAFLEIDFRHKPTYLGPHSKAVIHRDLGTSFALPALAAYDGYLASGTGALLVDE